MKLVKMHAVCFKFLLHSIVLKRIHPTRVKWDIAGMPTTLLGLRETVTCPDSPRWKVFSVVTTVLCVCVEISRCERRI